MSSAELASAAPSPMVEQEIDVETSFNSTKTPIFTSLHLKVPLVVTTSSNSGSVKDLDLYTTLSASQLYLGGQYCSVFVSLRNKVSNYV